MRILILNISKGGENEKRERERYRDNWNQTSSKLAKTRN